MKEIREDPRGCLPVAAAERKCRVRQEDGRLYDPETGRPLHGMVIGDRYELIGEIGRGGSCICYHAFDRERKVFVAVKEWFPLAWAREGLLERRGNTLELTTRGKAFEENVRESFEKDFDHEAEMSKNQRYADEEGWENNDPNVLVAELLRTGTWTQYLVMAREAGEPLSRVRFGGGTPEERLADILETGTQIASRLEWLHSEKGMIHCDIKPENIYVSTLNSGEAGKISRHILRLIDYGSGFPLTDGHVEPEHVTHLSCSPSYSPPELLALRERERWEEAVKQLSPATDVYSALRVLLEFLTPGVDPEERSSSDLWDSPFLKHLPEPVVERFCDFFESALSIKRLKTAGELGEALRGLIDLAECCISREWLRDRSENCVRQRVESERMFPMKFRREARGEEQSFLMFAATLPRALVLTGLAGAGKTTVMGRLADQLVKRETCIPLQIPLGKFDGTGHFVENWILYQILQLKNKDSDEQNRRRLMELFSEEGHEYYLLLDGYDEMSDPDKILSQLEELSKCVGVRLVISSRYLPNRRLLKERFEHAEVCPLPKTAVKEVLREKGLPGDEDERVLAMLTTPLWLSLYLGLPNDGRPAPRTTVELMERHVEHLLKRAEGNARFLHKEVMLPRVQETLRAVLPRFSWQLMREKRVGFDARRAEKILAGCVKDLDAEDVFDPMKRDAIPEAGLLAAGMVRDVLIPLGLVEEQNGIYAFSHGLFRDYFAACELARQMRGETLPEGLCAGALQESVAAFLAEMECVDPEALLAVWCRGKRGGKYPLAVRNLVEILKLRYKGDLSGRDLSDLDLTITDLVGCDLSGNGERPAVLRGSFLSDRTFDPVTYGPLGGGLIRPIPSARLVAMDAGGQTVFLDMDTLCIVDSIPARFTEFWLWDGCAWGWERGGTAIWKVAFAAGEVREYSCISIERPADDSWWEPRWLLDGVVYLSAVRTTKYCAFDLATGTMTHLDGFPAEAEEASRFMIDCLKGEWCLAESEDFLLYRVEGEDLHFVDAVTKEEWCLKNLPIKMESSVLQVYRDGENMSILTVSGELLLVNGERRERIALNRMPSIRDIRVGEDGCLEVVSAKTRSQWILENDAVKSAGGSFACEIDDARYCRGNWWKANPAEEKVSSGMLEWKRLSEPGMSVLTYSPMGYRKTALLLRGVDGAFPLGGGMMAIKRGHEERVELYGPDPKDTTQLAGRFMCSTLERFPPSACVRWGEGLVLYYPVSSRQTFEPRDYRSCLYYVTEHRSQWVPVADLLVQGCDLRTCEGLSDGAKDLLKTYGANV